MSNRVEILLATYNSATFLREQLDSLLAQSFTDFHLIVGDDGSRDETIAILEEYAPRFAHPVTILRRDPPTGSAAANFSRLLSESMGDYIFLADHDDIWLPDKVERALARIKAVEALRGAGTPVLTHSDLAVIDGQGAPLAPSYWTFKSISPAAGQHLNSALMHATVTGCAAAMNRALVARIGDVPETAVMHDWWINLVAAVFGVVDYDTTPSIKYRIHGRNVSRPRRTSFPYSLLQFDRVTRMRTTLSWRFAQGRAFYETYGAQMPAPERRALERFVAIPGSNPVLRRWRLVSGRFFWPGLWRNIASFAFI